MNFDEAPILVFWETTRACELACRHCRAEAMPGPEPGELTTNEGLRLIRQLAGFGPRPPVLVLTGGDVMSRPDLLELVGAARRAGLPVALAPSVTPRLMTGPLEELRGMGVNSVSLSLDGATSATHEAIRGVHGHFDQTIAALAHLGALGFKVQVNTAVMRANVAELAGIAAIVKEVDAASWEVFFLVKVGRGHDEQELGPADNEDVAHLLFDASHYGFAVRTVEGPGAAGWPPGARPPLWPHRPMLSAWGRSTGARRRSWSSSSAPRPDHPKWPVPAPGTARAYSSWPTTVGLTRRASCHCGWAT